MRFICLVNKQSFYCLADLDQIKMLTTLWHGNYIQASFSDLVDDWFTSMYVCTYEGMNACTYTYLWVGFVSGFYYFFCRKNICMYASSFNKTATISMGAQKETVIIDDTKQQVLSWNGQTSTNIHNVFVPKSIMNTNLPFKHFINMVFGQFWHILRSNIMSHAWQTNNIKKGW